MLIGAGTVLDPESARLAINAGASFLLAPTLHAGTIKMANRYQIPIIPGVFTPTEVLTATELGAQVVKVFPVGDRKSTRLNSSHVAISYAVFCLNKISLKYLVIII